MTYMRRDVWNLGGDWADPILWYARAVKLMRSRPITDPTSWTFLAAIHGFDGPTWQHFGYVDLTKPLPTPGVQKTYWAQCQHQSWYFLPWHRGYVWSFETIVRAAVVSLGGPADWALPYWNYNNTKPANANQLPPAFASADWPDGKGDNPLFTTIRYGQNVLPIVVPPNQIRPVAQADRVFTGGVSDPHQGFGGPTTTFHHGGEDHAPNGGLESEPHNNVHGLVGGGPLAGSDPNLATSYGLMSIPDQAALDPIFWLHHANIDRLWKVWHNVDLHNADPKDKAWLGGPATQTFAVPDAAGNKVTFTPADMRDTKAPNLDYVYEDETNPKPSIRRQVRLQALGVSPSVLAHVMAIPPEPKPAEVVGANDRPVDLAGGQLRTDVKFDAPAKARLVRTFSAALEPTGTTEPDRVFLELDNIRGVQDSALVEVYVGAPAGGDTPANLAGTISGFGLAKATRRGPKNGLTQVFDISSIVDGLHLQGGLADLQTLAVTFVPVTPLHAKSGVTVGAVKILRQPQ
jgi:tyrosinase